MNVVGLFFFNYYMTKDITIKDRVLALDQELLFSLYFGISINDINWSTEHSSNKLNNTLREDSDPSLTFKWFGNRLFSRDWANFNYSGDIFKVVGYIIGKNPNNSYEFVDICNHILETYNKKNVSRKHDFKLINTNYNITIKDISYIPRRLNKFDIANYSKYGICEKQIRKYVDSAIRFSIDNEESVYRYSGKDPCYVYSINRFYTKLYFPFRNKNSKLPRFLTNNVLTIDDLQEVAPAKDRILVKSIKDKMLVEQFIDYLGIKNIAINTVSSESNIVTNNIIKILNDNTECNIYTMFDLDKTGIDNMELYKDTFGYIPLIFSTKAKDPTDFVLQNNYLKALQCFRENYVFILSHRHNRKIKLIL